MAVIFLGFFGAVSFASAADYYVDQNNPQASDSNSGTEALPWQTLTKAANTVVAGDTVYVKAGRYTDTTGTWEKAFNPVNSGTASNPITFKSHTQGTAVLVSNGNGSVAIGIFERSYIVIDGFKAEGTMAIYTSDHITIQNSEVIYGSAGFSCQTCDKSLNWGIVVQGGSYCLVYNNYVHNMLNSGNTTHNTAAIMQQANSSYNIFMNNLADAGNGTVFSAYGQKGGNINYNVWKNNIATNCTVGFYGMGSTDETKYSTFNEYFNNIVTNCTSAFEQHHNSQDWSIYNNTAYNVTNFLSGGYYMESSNHDNVRNKVWNNLVYSAQNAFFREISTVTWSRFLSYADYNNFCSTQYLFYWNYGSSKTSDFTATQYGGVTFTNMTTVDPKFVNLSAGDYHLQSTSPLKGKGKNGEDIGAYSAGNECIGLLSSCSVSTDTTPPSAPSGVAVQ